MLAHFTLHIFISWHHGMCSPSPYAPIFKLSADFMQLCQVRDSDPNLENLTPDAASWCQLFFIAFAQTILWGQQETPPPHCCIALWDVIFTLSHAKACLCIGDNTTVIIAFIFALTFKLLLL